jgi:hypothetical protein
MKIAVRTSGKGPLAENKWESNSTSDFSTIIPFLESMCSQGHGCTVARRDGAIVAYFSGFESGLVDFQNRDIFVSIAILGISETSARALLLHFMEDHSGFRTVLLESVSRPSADEWLVNYTKIDELIEEAVKRVELDFQATPFDAPRADDFNEKAETNEGPCAKEQRESMNNRNIERLCQEIRDHRFSEGDGLKLVMAPTQAGYKKALQEADRLLWADGSKDDLVAARKKKELGPTTSTASTKSERPSSLPTCPSFVSSLIKVLFLETPSGDSLNPAARFSRRKLSIICGVVATLALGATVGSKWRGANAKKERQQAVEQARKEKDQEWEAKNAKNTEELRELKVKNAAPAQAPN